MIDMAKKYQTRDGRAVRILCVDGQDTSFPVVGFIEDHLCTHSWAADGHWLPPVGVRWGNSVDLIPVPTKHEGWIVVFPNEPPSDTFHPYIFSNKVAAMNYEHSDTRIGHVVPVTWGD